MLIEHGADVNAVKNGGSTPLHEAAFRENLDVAKVLIAAGAKNLSNKQNELPIDFLRGPEARDPRLRAELIDVLSRLPAPAQSNQSRSPGAQPESSLTVQSRTSEPAQSSVGNTEAQLTDTDPLRLVDRLLDRQSYETLLLGSVVVYGGSLGQPVQPPPGNNITVAQYSRYKQWANVGVINIQSQGSTSQRLQQSFSWNDWMSMTQGDQEKINVVPTQTAKEITQIAPNTLKIKMAAFKTENIVKNEERVMGLSKYDILMGLIPQIGLLRFETSAR